MIRRMGKTFVAPLLILGWVLLSGLDLVEDLGKVPGDGVVSNASSPDSLRWKRNGWGALANNILESATRIPQACVASLDLTALIFAFDVNFDFRRSFRLHKLYRVFLI